MDKDSQGEGGGQVSSAINLSSSVLSQDSPVLFIPLTWNVVHPLSCPNPMPAG